MEEIVKKKLYVVKNSNFLTNLKRNYDAGNEELRCQKYKNAIVY